MSVRPTLTPARQFETALGCVAAQSPGAARGLREPLRAVMILREAQPSPGRGTPLRHIRRFPVGTDPCPVDDSIGRDETLVRRFRRAARRPLSSRAAPGLGPRS